MPQRKKTRTTKGVAVNLFIDVSFVLFVETLAEEGCASNAEDSR
jgi:hypothetical protein